MANAPTAEAAGDIDRGNFSNRHRLELRIGFSETNLIHSELSRKGDAPLLARAEDLRISLLESGWIQLFASGATH